MEADTLNVIAENATNWSRRAWIERKRKLSSCIWCEGALLSHGGDKDLIYFAPEPTELGVIYEISKDDIVEATATGVVKEKLGINYKIVRLFIKHDAVVVKTFSMLAAELPSDLEALRAIAEAMSREAASPSLIHRAGTYSSSVVNREKNGGGGGASPSPSPSPRGGDGGGGTNGGGTAASGVRG